MALKASCKKGGLGSKVSLIDPDGGDSRFVINNDNKVPADLQVFVVDGCVITSGERCDYLVLPNKTAAVFVELKGGDVEKGLSQLRSSLNKLATSIKSRSRYAVLVPTRWPLPHYQLQRAQDEFRKKLGCKLKVKNLVYSSACSDWL